MLTSAVRALCVRRAAGAYMPRSRGIGMPRPKKQKLLPAETSRLESIVVEAAEIDQEEEAAESTSPVEEARPRTSPRGPKEEEAVLVHNDARETALIMQSIANKYADEKRLAERLFDAKMKRCDAKSKRQPKNPYGKVLRRYEAIIEVLEAKVKSATIDVKAAEAWEGGSTRARALCASRSLRLRA